MENIIRIGSCGSYVPELELLDIILTQKSYTEGNFAYNFDHKKCNMIAATEELNKAIEKKASDLQIKIHKANVLCAECFDPYLEDIKPLLARLPKEENIKASEMEAFALFYLAKKMHKKAACLLTVVDSICKKQELSAKERQEALEQMVILALETTRELQE